MTHYSPHIVPMTTSNCIVVNDNDSEEEEEEVPKTILKLLASKRLKTKVCVQQRETPRSETFLCIVTDLLTDLCGYETVPQQKHIGVSN